MAMSQGRRLFAPVGGQMVISQMVIIKWWYKNKLVIWFSNGDTKSNGDILFLNITKISPSDQIKSPSEKTISPSEISPFEITKFPLTICTLSGRPGTMVDSEFVF